MTVPRVYRGEVWWVNFAPTVGAEVQKPRPAVIIQHSQQVQPRNHCCCYDVYCEEHPLRCECPG